MLVSLNMCVTGTCSVHSFYPTDLYHAVKAKTELGRLELLRVNPLSHDGQRTGQTGTQGFINAPLVHKRRDQLCSD